jgi:hypothetical protein
MRYASVTPAIGMAITVFPRTGLRTAPVAPTLPSLVLLLLLIPPALDLLAAVQSASRAVLLPSLLAAALAAAALAVAWLRYVRASWLFAAALAATASLAMRLVDANVAPTLSLLAILAVGLSGGFASPSAELTRTLEELDGEPAPLRSQNSAERRPPVIAA